MFFTASFDPFELIPVGGLSVNKTRNPMKVDKDSVGKRGYLPLQKIYSVQAAAIQNFALTSSLLLGLQYDNKLY